MRVLIPRVKALREERGIGLREARQIAREELGF
jgi:hypothetical protein